MLAYETIKRCIQGKQIFIKPFSEKQLNANSYDVRLGYWFIWLKEFVADKPNYTSFFSAIDGEKVYIPTTGILLAITKERIGSRDNIVSQLRGKSSTARLGINVTQSAGVGDIGYYDQHWTASLSTNVPGTYLTVGKPFAQIVFHGSSDITEHPYEGQYAENDWPYVMIPKEYRDDFKNIVYGKNRRVIICKETYDNSWKNLIY